LNKTKIKQMLKLLQTL